MHLYVSFYAYVHTYSCVYEQENSAVCVWGPRRVTPPQHSAAGLSLAPTYLVYPDACSGDTLSSHWGYR